MNKNPITEQDMTEAIWRMEELTRQLTEVKHRVQNFNAWSLTLDGRNQSECAKTLKPKFKKAMGALVNAHEELDKELNCEKGGDNV